MDWSCLCEGKTGPDASDASEIVSSDAGPATGIGGVGNAEAHIELEVAANTFVEDNLQGAEGAATKEQKIETDGKEVIANARNIEEAKSQVQSLTLPIPARVDPSVLASSVSGTPTDQVRAVLSTALLEPVLLNGYPLSVLAGENNTAIKKALLSIDDAKSKVLVKSVFDDPDGGHTHRKCVMKLHDGCLEVGRECVTPDAAHIGRTPTEWQDVARKEAEEEGIQLKPGTVLSRILLGPDVLGQCAKSSTPKSMPSGAHAHFLALSNPSQVHAFLDVLQCLFQLHHIWQENGTSGSRTGADFFEALGAAIPETKDVFCTFLDAQRTQYEVEAVGDIAGALRHSWSSYWNWPAIEKRWGKAARLDIQRVRPAHSLIVVQGGSEDDPYNLFTFCEDNGFMKASFLTAKSGHLLRADKSWQPLLHEGTPQRAPSFLSGDTFRVHVTDVKIQFLGCGCWIPRVDGPSLCFAFQGSEAPHPTFQIWCKDVSAFPMEWFWSPLLDAAQLRVLLVRDFMLRFVFRADEAHLNLTFQMPKPSGVLRKFARLAFGMFIRAVKAPAEEDPLDAFAQAVAEDCRRLEKEVQKQAAAATTTGAGAGAVADAWSLTQQSSASDLVRQASNTSSRTPASNQPPPTPKSGSSSSAPASVQAADLEKGIPATQTETAGVAPRTRRCGGCLCRRRATS